MKIFLLEDDETVCFGIKTFLGNNGYLVKVARLLSEAKKKFDYNFDLILLDVNLPDGTGFDFLKIFAIKSIPIIFLTVNDSEEDIVNGLNISDGYITKPFKLSILKAKIESVLRRVGGTEPKLSYKGLILDEKNYKCLVDGEDINLTLKEYSYVVETVRGIGYRFVRD